MTPEELQKHIGDTVVFREGWNMHYYACAGTLRKIGAKKATIKCTFGTRYIYHQNILHSGGDNSCWALVADLTKMYRESEEGHKKVHAAREKLQVEILQNYS